MNLHKILIVDDDRNLRTTLEEILQTRDFDAESTGSGKNAIALSAKEDYSVVLMDLRLDDISGPDLLKAIKKQSPHTECIVLTGNASTETAIESINLGAYSYIQKPYDIDQLILTINRAIEKNQARHALLESEERFKQLYEGAIDGILVTDLEGNILDFNAALLRLLGFKAEELMQKSIWELTPEKYHEQEKKYIQQILRQEYSDIYEKEFFRKDDTLTPVEISGYLTRDSQGNPIGMWGFIRDISERRKSEEKLKRQLTEVSALHDVSTAGSMAETVDELIEKVTETLGHWLYSDTFGINVYDKKRHWVIPHVSYHGSDFLEKGKGFDADLGITGRAIKTRLPQQVGDVNKDQDYIRSMIESRSELAVPIMVNDEVFGVLNAESREPEFFKQEDLDLLSSISRQMAIAIERIQLRESQAQRNKELSALYETSLAVSNILDAQSLYERVYAQIRGIFNPDAFLLATYDPIKESTSIVYAVEENQPIKEILNQTFEKEDSGLMGWLMRHQKSLLFGDMTTEKLPVESPQEGKPIRSWLGVPLIIKGTVVGAISVQCFEADVYGEDHLRLLDSMGAQLAVALDNARLVEQSQRQIERLAALHDIDTAINSSLDLRVTMNILLDQVIEKLDVDAAAVLLLNPQNRRLEFTASRGFITHGIERYSIELSEGLSGQSAMEQHLIQALDLGITDDKQGYPEIMQNEGFVSYFSVPLIAKGQIKGVLDVFHRSPLNPDQDWFNFLETLAGQAAIAIDNTTLLDDVNRTNLELTLAYDTTLEGWSKALDMRDRETEGHTRRVARFDREDRRQIGDPGRRPGSHCRGALLHDIGKMGIPDNIFVKPGPLDDKEWEIMRSHSTRAVDLLYPITYLRPALDIPSFHHEKFDGSGYPKGLKGEQIPIAARVFAVVDVWDALTSDRPYRKAWTAKKSLEYIKDQSGSHFDPQVVDIFLELIQSELINGKAGE